jgi:uncharacterized protein (TIGR03032 family)
MLFIVAPRGSGAELLAAMLPGTPQVFPTVAEGLTLDAEARFVYVYRDPGAAAPSPELAETWAAETNALLAELEALPPERWCVTSYDQLLTHRDAELARIATFAQIEAPPKRTILPEARDAATRARALFAKLPADRVRVDPPQMSFESVHTPTFAQILHTLGVSLLVTTYQSNRVIVVRAEDGKVVNTHLRTFRSPMGVAVGHESFVLGTRTEIWDYRNHADVAPKIEPKGKHDACFVPRNMHVTGDIRVHELVWAQRELWIVNTRFSTLCTLDRDHSFVPRWRPPFITELAAEDRCHLNGVCVVDDQVRYVTALGESNLAHGWRETKAHGGIVMDVASNEILLRNLSMPHSPRWFSDRFWVLESGKGEVCTADLARGTTETVAQLPGFTRGLAFAGPFAFVGLSQVRESNIFGGIPLVERVPERRCGVWVVDTRTGGVVAFLRFEGTVQEIFDVQILPRYRYPELLEPTDEWVASTFTL